MALLRKGSPYIPGYAIPQNVIDEPFRRGAIVSKYRKRKTISDPSTMRNPRNPGGYILPQSVRDEPLGQGVRTTHYTKRGTIFGLIPEIVTARQHTERVGVGIFDDNMSAGKLGVLSSATMMGKSSLGALADAPGGGRDGIAQLSKQVAGMIMAGARQFRTPAEKKIFMQAVLGNIDPSFPAAVEAKAELLMKSKKYDAKTALLKAITVVTANHTFDQIMQMGKTGRRPTRGLMGLGACCGGSPDGLGGVWGSIKEYAGRSTGVILAPATGGLSLALTAPKTADKVADKAKALLGKIGDVACKITNSGLLKLGATVTGAATAGPGGAQAGSSGADVAQTFCTPTASPVDSGSGFPIVPVVIGGGAILLAVILLR